MIAEAGVTFSRRGVLASSIALSVVLVLFGAALNACGASKSSTSTASSARATNRTRSSNAVVAPTTAPVAAASSCDAIFGPHL